MNYSFKTISLLSSDPRICRGIRDSTIDESKESSSLTEVEYELDYDLLLDIIEPLKTDYQKDYILISKQDARIPSDVSYVKDEEALVSEESKLVLDDPSCSENKSVDIPPKDGDASRTDGKLEAIAINEAKDYQYGDTFVVKRNLSHWKEKTKAVHNFAKATILPIFAKNEAATKIQEIQMKELQYFHQRVIK